MSQQEFRSQAEEGKQFQFEEEVYARPRANKKNVGAIPKSEHPSTFDEMPYSYRAQDNRAQDIREPEDRPQKQQASQQSRTRGRNFSPDGDAFETGYRPYQLWARRSAASSARSQSRGVGRLIFLVILAVILLPILFKVLIFFLAALAFVAFGFLFFALIVVGIGAMVFFALRRSLGWSRRTSWHW